MRTRITPGSISGEIMAPPSKSVTQRALAAALLHKGTTKITGAGHSDDELAALEVIKQLGATVTHVGNMIQIESSGVAPKGGEVNCGESGLAARLFTPIAAFAGVPITITGSGTLLSRPMHGFKEALTALGVTIAGFDGHLPVTVAGPVMPQSISVSGADGSQLVSGLLFALCSAVTSPVTLTVTDLKSKPYIDLTQDMLARFGKPVKNIDYREFYIDPSLFTHSNDIEINIEGDWSGAANFLVAGAITGNMEVSNLDYYSTQADKMILTVLQQTGVRLSLRMEGAKVTQSVLLPFEADATDCPDLFPILAILAACCEGESFIKGVHRLFNKESNRAESITEMLQNFDVPFSILDDFLCVTGVRKLQGTVIDSYNDHRIAMAAAIGALRATGPVDILHSQSVNKSYPDFFNVLSLCGITTDHKE